MQYEVIGDETLKMEKFRVIREIDIGIFKNMYWYFVYVDGMKFKRSKNFLKLSRMIKKLKSICRRRIESNRADFTDVINEKYGGADYLFNFKVFDKGYAFFLVGLGEGCISPLFKDFDELFEDLEEVLENVREGLENVREGTQ